MNTTEELRTFPSGATRDTDAGKLDYEACLSPLVLRRYAEYQAKHNPNRPQDNWQKGIPIAELMKSLWRHFMDVWSNHRGIRTAATLEDSLCAMLFNANAYLHHLVKHRESLKPK